MPPLDAKIGIKVNKTDNWWHSWHYCTAPRLRTTDLKNRGSLSRGCRASRNIWRSNADTNLEYKKQKMRSLWRGHSFSLLIWKHMQYRPFLFAGFKFAFFLVFLRHFSRFEMNGSFYISFLRFVFVIQKSRKYCMQQGKTYQSMFYF